MSDRADPILAALVRIDSHIDALGEELGGRMGLIENRIGRIETELTRLRAETMDRLDRQQDILAAVKDDAQVTIAEVDTTREDLKAVRDREHMLAHQVSLVHRRLIQLEQRFDARENRA